MPKLLSPAIAAACTLLRRSHTSTPMFPALATATGQLRLGLLAGCAGIANAQKWWEWVWRREPSRQREPSGCSCQIFTSPSRPCVATSCWPGTWRMHMVPASVLCAAVAVARADARFQQRAMPAESPERRAAPPAAKATLWTSAAWPRRTVVGYSWLMTQRHVPDSWFDANEAPCGRCLRCLVAVAALLLPRTGFGRAREDASSALPFKQIWTSPHAHDKTQCTCLQTDCDCPAPSLRNDAATSMPQIGSAGRCGFCVLQRGHSKQ
jgi:hypothetical protein